MINYHKRTLDNGLTVIVEQDTSTTLTAVNVLYKVGSRNESPSKTGVAHLFEHLMFEGSRHAPDFDTPLQMAGGENNAFTNNDYTNFYDVVPAANIETALWLEADRMSALNLNTEALELQKKVVIEEFKEVCLNKPYGDNWHHLSALAYKRHPYRWPTIGFDIDHVASVTLADVHDFYSRYYQPSNAILSLSGPLDEELVFDLANKWFGDLSSQPRQESIIEIEEDQMEKRYQKVISDVPLPIFLVACHMPGRRDDDYYACDLLSDILSNGKSSRLYDRLVHQEKAFTSVDCYLSGSMDPGLILIEGKPLNISVETGVEMVWNEVLKIQSHPPTKRELQKVKNKVLSSIAMHDLSILNKAASLAYFEFVGMLDKINQQEELYNRVTIEDVIRVCENYMLEDKSSLLEYQPNAD